MLQGNGVLTIDNNSFDLKEGSVIRVTPDGVRVIKALDKGLVFLCIQAKEKSLLQYTLTDGKVLSK